MFIVELVGAAFLEIPLISVMFVQALRRQLTKSSKATFIFGHFKVLQ